jgi:hypothetical protein
MSEPANDDVQPGIDEADVTSRAELLPEEQAAGSDDAEAQAEGILADSEERTLHPQQTGEDSVQTAPPRERPGTAS